MTKVTPMIWPCEAPVPDGYDGKRKQCGRPAETHVSLEGQIIRVCDAHRRAIGRQIGERQAAYRKSIREARERGDI